MIDLEPSPEQLAVADAVRSFVKKEIEPLEPMMLQRGKEGGHTFLTRAEQRELQLKAKASGLWGIDTKEEYGGADLDWVSQALVFQELNHSFVRFSFGGTAPEVLSLGNPDQLERYYKPTLAGDRIFCFALSEPGGGSDAHNIKTKAVRSGDDWIIDGEKMWITFGEEADYTLVFCRTPDEPEGGITAFLVDRDMGWKSTSIPLMGSHDPASLVFDGVRVPDANRFSEIGGGMKLAMKFIHRNRLVLLASRHIGASQRLIEMGLEWAKNRVTMGERLIDRENIKFALAESDVELKALKLLVLQGCWQHDSGRDPRQAANVAKYYGATVANRIVDRVLQIHGGMGYAKEMPIEKYYRDLRVERIHEGSDEMQLISMMRNVLKGYNNIGEIW